MQLISENYKELNQKLHSTKVGYGKAAKFWVPRVYELLKSTDSKSLLDYGCGKGLLVGGLKKQLPKIQYTEYDPAIEGKDILPSYRHDLVVCGDVLEHIEPEYLPNVLDHLFNYIHKAGHIVIARKPSDKQLADGRNAHLIIQSHDAWYRLLQQYCNKYNLTIGKAIDHEKVPESEFLIYSNEYLKSRPVQHIEIVCFAWAGETRHRWKNKPEVLTEYVNKLYRGVGRNLTIPFRFTCFVDDTVYCQAGHKLNAAINVQRFDSPSWAFNIAKLKAFDPANGLQGRVAVLDIDLVITGLLDEICSYTGELMTRAAWKVNPNKGKLSNGDIALFEAGTLPFWEWAQDKKQIEKLSNNGKERLIYQYYGADDFIQDLYPNQMLSYKRHLKGATDLPFNCRMVSFHGQYDIRQCKEKWVRRNWHE